jgi:hypothetical protein
MGFSVLVDMDSVNAMAAYQPVVQACVRITLTESISTSKEKTISVVLAQHRTAP